MYCGNDFKALAVSSDINQMVHPVALAQEHKRHQQKSGKHSERDEAKVRWRQNDKERERQRHEGNGSERDEWQRLRKGYSELGRLTESADEENRTRQTQQIKSQIMDGDQVFPEMGERAIKQRQRKKRGERSKAGCTELATHPTPGPQLLPWTFEPCLAAWKNLPPASCISGLFSSSWLLLTWDVLIRYPLAMQLEVRSSHCCLSFSIRGEHSVDLLYRTSWLFIIHVCIIQC